MMFPEEPLFLQDSHPINWHRPARRRPDLDSGHPARNFVRFHQEKLTPLPHLFRRGESEPLLHQCRQKGSEQFLRLYWKGSEPPLHSCYRKESEPHLHLCRQKDSEPHRRLYHRQAMAVHRWPGHWMMFVLFHLHLHP